MGNGIHFCDTTKRGLTQKTTSPYKGGDSLASQNSVAFCSPAKSFTFSGSSGKPISWQKVKVLTAKQSAPKRSGTHTPIPQPCHRSAKRQTAELRINRSPECGSPGSSAQGNRRRRPSMSEKRTSGRCSAGNEGMSPINHPTGGFLGDPEFHSLISY